MTEIYLLWAYSSESVYGQVNNNKDVIGVFTTEEAAYAQKRKLEETVAKKFNVEYRVTSKELRES